MEKRVQLHQEFIDPFFMNRMLRGTVFAGAYSAGKVRVESPRHGMATEFSVTAENAAGMPPAVQVQLIGRNIYATFEIQQPPQDLGF